MSALRTLALFGLLAAVYPACAQAQSPDGPRYDTCLSLDQNGRPIPNPNASYGCAQIEFERQDCEALRRAMPAADTPVMNVTHCRDFRMEDVRARPGGVPAATRADQKVGGGS